MSTTTTRNSANPVSRLDEATRNKRLLDSYKKGDVVRENARHPGEWLVSSSTYDRVFYRVQYDEAGKTFSCGCHWFQHKGQACRHLVRISWEIHEARREARATHRKARASARKEGQHGQALPALQAALSAAA